ncbi:DUF2867 domain-containing protein [Nocardia aurantia]|uniref:DUF2867 domain-containing protein n=1 Tax=Nocardia aurantia TaxID=2585199 RepID=A0A7K0DQM7_9NOCA|nr:DUF2867 domain-containing protein [Nocardia aurantia]MQY28059.1 hypothetical protein [Nocardia aurantia]
MTAQRIRRVATPSYAVIGDGMPSADYVSAFELDMPLESSAPRGNPRTSEQWARAIFEQAPAVMRILLLLGWRLVLRLRLRSGRSAGFVLGWRIVSAEPERTVLEAHSPFLMARNIVGTSGSAVTWTTLVRFERRIARSIWNVVRPVHQLATPYLFRRAARYR